MGLRVRSRLHLFVTLAVSFLVAGCLGEEAVKATPAPVLGTESKPDRALLAFEKVVSGPLVAGMNVTVSYLIHNVGLHPASDISLRDASYPASRFESDGTARKTWEALTPGESLSHSINVQPRRAGQLFVSPPSVSYTDAKDGQKHVARLAGEGEDDAVTVENLLDYRRQNDHHTTAWALYSGAFALLGVAPFLISASMEKQLSKPTTQHKKSS